MRVKARAVIWIDGLLIVAQQPRGGRTELTLPGGRVNDHESVIDALKREVSEETGLEIDPGPLLYISEIRPSTRSHDLELIFLAQANGVPALRGCFQTIDVHGEHLPQVRPAILQQIAADAQAGWLDNPRWLGDLRAVRPHATAGTPHRPRRRDPHAPGTG